MGVILSRQIGGAWGVTFKKMICSAYEVLFQTALFESIAPQQQLHMGSGNISFSVGLVSLLQTSPAESLNDRFRHEFLNTDLLATAREARSHASR